jgi:Uma2 family endonuclease
MSTDVRRMTVEEFLRIPDDGIERWLIDGEVYEFDPDPESLEHGMTIRNEMHSFVMGRFAQFLNNWRDSTKPPRGKVVCGEAGVRFSAKSSTTVGVDVAYVPPQVQKVKKGRSTVTVGVPALIVEVLSPSDTQKNIAKKVNTYLKARVPHIWVVDPEFQTVMVHRPGAKAFSVGVDGVLTAEPEMPGLKIALSSVFE